MWPGLIWARPVVYHQICRPGPQAVWLVHISIRLSVYAAGNGDANNQYPVCVECSNGNKFYADVCLVTISLGYLKQHAERMFDPVLPNFKTAAIGRIAMGTVNKVILEFDGQVR